MTNLSHGEAGTDASKSRSCAHCGGAIRADARAHAKYCSTQCRQKASRAGKSVTSVDDDGDEDDAALPPTRRAHVVAGVGVLAVGLALLTVSLGHLESGVVTITKASELDAWLTATSIDAGFVACELSILVAPDAIRATISRYASPAIIETLATSAAFNAFAFSAHADGWLAAPAIALGFAVPGLIFCLTKIGSQLFFSEENHQ
jgi:hypothetical protein